MSWSTATGKKVQEHAIADGETVRGLAPDCKRFVTMNKAGDIVLRDVETAKTLKQIKLPLAPHQQQWAPWALSPGGKQLVVEEAINVLNFGSYPSPPFQHHWIDLDEGELYRTVPGKFKSSQSLVFSSDGKWLAATDKDGVATLWDAATGKMAKHEGKPLKFHAPALTFVKEGKVLLAAAQIFDKDKGKKYFRLSWYDTGTGKMQNSRDSAEDTVFRSFSPDGSLMAYLIGKRTLEVAETKTGKVLASLDSPDIIYSLRFSPAGDMLAIDTAWAQITLWHLPKKP